MSVVALSRANADQSVYGTYEVYRGYPADNCVLP